MVTKRYGKSCCHGWTGDKTKREERQKRGKIILNIPVFITIKRNARQSSRIFSTKQE
jgi:hypothetical protein